jgi:hypothetical protein
MMLHALRELETQHQGGSFFYVWSILNQMTASGLVTAADVRQAAYLEGRAAVRADIERRAADGDDGAKDALRQVNLADALGSTIRASFRQRRGTKPIRKMKFLERDINPSRCLAALAKRGLVDRQEQKGVGSSAALTDEGRRFLASSAP